MSQTTIKILFAAELLPDIQYTDGYMLLLYIYTEGEECVVLMTASRGRGYWCDSISHHYQRVENHRNSYVSIYISYILNVPDDSSRKVIDRIYVYTTNIRLYNFYLLSIHI